MTKLCSYSRNYPNRPRLPNQRLHRDRRAKPNRSSAHPDSSVPQSRVYRPCIVQAKFALVPTFRLIVALTSPTLGGGKDAQVLLIIFALCLTLRRISDTLSSLLSQLFKPSLSPNLDMRNSFPSRVPRSHQSPTPPVDHVIL